MDAKNSKKVVKFKIRTMNTLVFNNHTETAKLNGMQIDQRAFIPLVKRITLQYPGSLIIDNEHNTVWLYPIESSNATEENIELENGTADAEAFTNWTEDQHEQSLDL